MQPNRTKLLALSFEHRNRKCLLDGRYVSMIPCGHDEMDLIFGQEVDSSSSKDRRKVALVKCYMMLTNPIMEGHILLPCRITCVSLGASVMLSNSSKAVWTAPLLLL